MIKRTAHKVTTHNTTYYVLTKVFPTARSEWESDSAQTSVWGTNGRSFHEDKRIELTVGEPMEGECGVNRVRTSPIKCVERITLKEIDRQISLFNSKRSQIYF